MIICTAPPYLSDLLELYTPAHTLSSSANNRVFRIPNRRKIFQGQRIISSDETNCIWMCLIDCLPPSCALLLLLLLGLFFIIFYSRHSSVSSPWLVAKFAVAGSLLKTSSFDLLAFLLLLLLFFVLFRCCCCMVFSHLENIIICECMDIIRLREKKTDCKDR